MATEKPRILVTVTEEMVQAIDDYRFGARGKSFAAAVRSLIDMGLEEAMKDLATPEGMEKLRRRLEAADYKNFDKEPTE